MLARLVAQSKSRPDVSFGRALLVAAFICFWMMAVSARLVYLQVSQHEGLSNRARQQQQNAAQTENRRFIWIARRLDAEKAQPILDLKLPGVQSVQEPKRYYPNGSLASHILGFVGIDGKGQGGVELSQNAKISGEPGLLFLEKDAARTAYESFEVASKPGQTVVLT